MTASAFSFPDPGLTDPVIACLNMDSDGRDVAAIAANYARWLGRPLVLFQSIDFEPAYARVPDPLEWQLRRSKALRELEEARDRLDVADIPLSLEVGEGNWIEALSNRLQTVSDPLVVIGASSHGNTGHLVAALLEGGTGKVLVIPEGCDATGEQPHVAVPLDGSLFSEAALAEAITIAKMHPSELLLVHVMPLAGLEAIGPLATNDLELQMQVERRNEAIACTFLETTLRRLRDMGLTARSRCQKGDPRSCLASLLIAEAPGLVMLSARGQGIRSCEDLTLGSTANYLLDHLPFPVMMVGSTVANRGDSVTGLARAHEARNLRLPLNSSPALA